MKIKLPLNAQTKDAGNGLNRIVVKIPRMLGWDIANVIAKENNMNIGQLISKVGMNVYSDHIIIDMIS